MRCILTLSPNNISENILDVPQFVMHLKKSVEFYKIIFPLCTHSFLQKNNNYSQSGWWAWLAKTVQTCLGRLRAAKARQKKTRTETQILAHKTISRLWQGKMGMRKSMRLSGGCGENK